MKMKSDKNDTDNKRNNIDTNDDIDADDNQS